MGLKSKIKNYFKRRKEIDLLKDAFLQSNSKNLLCNEKPVFFSGSENPLVSIILIWDQTSNLNCFDYLNQNTTIAHEIIVVTPNDDYLSSLKNVQGIQILQGNDHLISKINRAISLSKGEFIYTINSKFTVAKNYLEELLSVFKKFADCKIVGSQIINEGLTSQGLFFSGQLQESYPKSIYNPEVNYVRRTDFYSDFSFLIKKINDSGDTVYFNENYTSIAYSIADFCVDLKFNHQKQAYITPFSKIYLSNSSQKNIAENSNSSKFEENWLPFIKNINSDSAESRIQELYNNKSVVIVCRPFPEHDKDSGSNRLKEIIEALRALDYFVTIYCKDTFSNNPYLQNYLREGTNAYYEFEKNISIKEYLQNQEIKPDFFWYYGPIAYIDNYKMARKYFPKSKLIYDMVDIHHLRFKRAIELDSKRVSLRKKYKYHKKIEIEASKTADYLIAISEFENEYMSKFCDIKKIRNISNVHYPKIKKEKTLAFEDRKNILFIGSIHAPNIDSLHYLYNEIMPIVWNKIPDLKVNIIGNVKNSIKDINHENFVFLGYLPIIEDYFISSKFMVAPLRYGAGVKGKIGQSLEYYLPAITTSIGAEGMKLTNKESALIEDTATGFANAIIDLYTNKELWEKLQNNSEKSLEPFSKENLKNVIRKIANNED